MADPLDTFLGNLMAAAENAMQIIGEQTVEYGKELIGIEVEKQQDGTVVRSLPGEPPRKEYGNLQAGLEQTVDRQGSERVELSVISGDDERPAVPSILELGQGPVKQRPYLWGSGSAGEKTMAAKTIEISRPILTEELDKVR